MRLIDRYIGRTVVASTASVMFVLLTLYFFSTLVGELRRVGEGSYTFAGMLQYALLLMPRQIYQLFPLAALMGSMLGLGALASSSELTVIQAAGVSTRRIVGSILKVGLLLVVVVVTVGELIAPPLEKYASAERARALSEEFITTGEGLWAREGQTFVHVRSLLRGGAAQGITLYHFGADHALTETVHAQRGAYGNGEWRLEEVRITTIAETGISVRSEPEMAWNTGLTPQVIDIVAVRPENLSIQDIYEYMEYLRENRLDAERYELAFWTRITTPFATAGMVLLAIPLIFGSLRTVSIGQRVMVGGLLGIGFYMFNGIFGRVGLLYSLPPLLSAALPTLVVFALWLVLMRRVA